MVLELYGTNAMSEMLPAAESGIEATNDDGIALILDRHEGYRLRCAAHDADAWELRSDLPSPTKATERLVVRLPAPVWTALASMVESRADAKADKGAGASARALGRLAFGIYRAVDAVRGDMSASAAEVKAKLEAEGRYARVDDGEPTFEELEDFNEHKQLAD